MYIHIFETRSPTFLSSCFFDDYALMASRRTKQRRRFSNWTVLFASSGATRVTRGFDDSKHLEDRDESTVRESVRETRRKFDSTKRMESLAVGRSGYAPKSDRAVREGWYDFEFAKNERTCLEGFEREFERFRETNSSNVRAPIEYRAYRQSLNRIGEQGSIRDNRARECTRWCFLSGVLFLRW